MQQTLKILASDIDKLITECGIDRDDKQCVLEFLIGLNINKTLLRLILENDE